ncbi:ABC transporter permease [Aureimonas glaciei]|uniref:Glutathione ABC transporter permease GsiD n=1 Tax=Aureimonas glaciei TaxID=1776957 RepID=A0A917DEM3_9HYPH|nr:ABC transporter permease [Aureimonas glaciei]GGD31610.1 glutathione ABC transporter permease GsiD [Aureimonas glaciei]
MTVTDMPASGAVATGGGTAASVRRRSIFLRRPFFTMALLVTLAFVACALFAPWLAPYDPLAQSIEAMMMPPSATHLLGTDSFGKDILSRIIFGARTALLIGLVSVVLGAIGGLVLGVAAGLATGWLQWALLRLIDSILALPSLILAVALIAILGQGVDKVILAVGFSLIGPFARTVRSDVLQVKAQLFIEAAGLMGLSQMTIVRRHILPNVVFPLMVQVTIRVSEAILVSSSLSFLGIGVTPPTPDWGLMIAEGRGFVSFAAWMSGMPGMALALLLIALAIVGDGVREEFDPKLKRAR